VLKKQGGWMGSLWQNRFFSLCAATSTKPPKLLYANVESASDDLFAWNGSITLTSAAAAAAHPDRATDFTLSNVDYSHKASDKRTIDLRAESKQLRDEWVAAINAEIKRAKGSALRAAAVCILAARAFG
jgi:hypothetical protein